MRLENPFGGDASPVASPYDFPTQPRNFREAEDVTGVKLRSIPPTFSTKRTRVRGARAAGIRYEKKIHVEFLRRYPKHYLPSPWFQFWDKHGARWCQPDGLIIDPAQSLIVISEVKHTHTGEAWWKLLKLYLPVVRHFFGNEWEYRCIEVVRFYDPLTAFPCARLMQHPHIMPKLPEVGVHICKPK